MSIQLDFSGEIVLVTGGATGLGFATARAFGLHGATVALNDLTEDRVEAASERLRQESIACRGYVADVRDAGAVSALVTTLEVELGAPDVVVANAGLFPNTPFLEMSEAEWDRIEDFRGHERAPPASTRVGSIDKKRGHRCLRWREDRPRPLGWSRRGDFGGPLISPLELL
jgi:hypothetical protein